MKKALFGKLKGEAARRRPQRLNCGGGRKLVKKGTSGGGEGMQRERKGNLFAALE